MEKKTRSIQRMITIILVLAVLIMALPMTVMAKGKGKANAYGQSKIKTAEEDELEPIEEEEEEEPSERSLLVAERNTWARLHGVPPGHANLLYKFMSKMPVESKLTLTEKLQEFYDDFLATFEDGKPENYSVKGFRDWIKGLTITESGFAEEPIDV